MATDLLSKGDRFGRGRVSDDEVIRVVPNDSGRGYRTTAGMHAVKNADHLLELIQTGISRRAQVRS